LEIFACVFGSLALRTISLSSLFAFGDFAAFSILLMSFPIASTLPSRSTHGPLQAVKDTRQAILATSVGSMRCACESLWTATYARASSSRDDLRATRTPGAQRADPCLDLRTLVLPGSRCANAGPVDQARVAFGAPAGQPLVARPREHPSSLTTCATGRPWGHDALDEQPRAVHGQPDAAQAIDPDYLGELFASGDDHTLMWATAATLPCDQAISTLSEDATHSPHRSRDGRRYR
jgi:hypothetical protein